MTKTILVCGHGPGISDAVARRFGKDGFAVALVARNGERLEAAVAALRAEGVKACALRANLGDPVAVRAMVEAARRELGPITAVHWNAYASGAGDLLTASADEMRGVLDVGVTGLLAAVQAALPDLRAQAGESAVLITGGGFAFYDAGIDAMATQYHTMGLAVAKAAQHKLAGLLSAKLTPERVYVGEVVVTGMVKGTAFDMGNATVDPNDVAARFFDLYTRRAEATALVG